VSKFGAHRKIGFVCSSYQAHGPLRAERHHSPSPPGTVRNAKIVGFKRSDVIQTALCALTIDEEAPRPTREIMQCCDSAADPSHTLHVLGPGIRINQQQENRREGYPLDHRASHSTSS